MLYELINMETIRTVSTNSKPLERRGEKSEREAGTGPVFDID